jgi:NADH-quinone oxidoreductase subunit G
MSPLPRGDDPFYKTGRDMPTFKLDGKSIPFEPGESIIRAAEKAGVEIPHYCYHPGLSAPANCRMCLVEILPAANQRAMMLDIVEWDEKLGDYRTIKKPKLQPACQFPATDGQEVLAEQSPHVIAARAGVQEFLLLNHPVDCPICDQAGECKLQDYWLEHQQTPKRMHDEPVHKPKAVSFGDTIVYDAERCVMCTRCIRFMEEVAKDPVLDMRERGNLKEVIVAPGRKLEGHYTFMTEHVCPVGALTTKDFRFKARVWFLKSAKTVCQGCATGCNATFDYDPRTNKALRYRPRDNERVNKFWMCDEGMLSYRDVVEGRVPEAQVSGKTVKIERALEEIKKRFASVQKGSIAFVLSAKHSLEDNLALFELAELCGSRAIYTSGAPAGYSDDILIHADKNSNTAGIQNLAPDAKSFDALLADARAGKVTHVIALGGAAPTDDVSALEGLQGLCVVAAHVGPLTRAASVVLPASAWIEASGTFVNAKGMRQLAEKGTEPLGSAEPGWKLVAKVAVHLGVEPSWTTLKDVRAMLVATSVPPPEPSQTASAE